MCWEGYVIEGLDGPGGAVGKGGVKFDDNLVAAGIRQESFELQTVENLATQVKEFVVQLFWCWLELGELVFWNQGRLESLVDCWSGFAG